MTSQNTKLIQFLNKAIDRLSTSENYQWGHSGACNCGHLAQVMTGKSKGELLKISQVREGDWTQQAEKYCDTSGLEIDNVIGIMMKQGLLIEDIGHIEYLSNPAILEKLPGGKRHLERNQKDNVMLYFQAWITLLEEMETQNRDWSSKDSEQDGQIAIYDSVPEEAY